MANSLTETSLSQLLPDHLEIKLIEDLERYQTFEENALALNYVATKKPTETNTEFSKRAQQEARIFTIAKPDEKHPDPNLQHSIHSSDNRES